MMKKIYLKLFLIQGLIFGILMSLWDYIDEGEIDFAKSGLMALTFGGVMTWTSVVNMKKAKRKLENKDLTEEDFKVPQFELIIKTKTIPEVYDLLKSNKRTENWHISLEGSKIVGKTKKSWSLQGEKIMISDVGDKVRIESKPVLVTAIFDNGKNRMNVLIMKELIMNDGLNA